MTNNTQQFFLKYYEAIIASFKLATKGKESLSTLMWLWGLLAYILAHFAEMTVIRIDSRITDIVISVLAIVYFSWHIYVLRKCSPKKPKLTKEEKKRIKLEKKRGRGKRLMRKMLLKEPFSEWNPVLICTVVDLYFVATFLYYI